MKRYLRPVLLFLFLIALCFGGLLLSARAEAAEIDGIDYNRFTQRAMKGDGASVSEVSLFLNDLEFKGKLTGTLGLTLEEMNEIIRSEMRILGLNETEIKVLSTIGADLDKNVKIEMGKKLAVALANYIPSAGPLSAADVAKYAAYGPPKVDDVIVDKTKGFVVDQFQEIAKNERAELAKQLGKGIGKTPKVGLGVMGFAVNSVDVAMELADTSQFDQFCKDLEEKYEKIGKFYILTSQLMNKRAAEKNASGAVLQFDRATAKNECVFLGVDGVIMTYTLTGKLSRTVGEDEIIDAGDNRGDYEGDLTLVVEGSNLASFDARFHKTSNLWALSGMVDDWCQIFVRYPGLESAQEDFLTLCLDTVNRPTVLKRTLVGHFRVRIGSWDKGVIKPELSGKFNNVSDTLEWVFEHNIAHEYFWEQVDPVTFEPLGKPLEQYHITSIPGTLSEIHISWVGNRAAEVENRAGMEEYKGGRNRTITKRELGTVWYPLEFAPEIRITVR